jgi:hypothetical protein
LSPIFWTVKAWTTPAQININIKRIMAIPAVLFDERCDMLPSL